MKELFVLLFVNFVGLDAQGGPYGGFFGKDYVSPFTGTLGLYDTDSIPYRFEENYPQEGRKRFKRAVEEFNKHTCRTFRHDQDSKEAYLVQDHKLGCGATKGKHFTEPKWPISKNVFKINSTHCLEGHILRQLMYFLGVEPEHKRLDRDKFIYINLNISKKWTVAQEEFYNISRKGFNNSVPYDYSSIMHPPHRDCCSPEAGKEVIGSHVVGATALMGQRYGLTLFDIMKINRLYRCNNTFYNGEDLYPLPPYKKEIYNIFRHQRVDGKYVSEIEIPGVPDESGVIPKSKCVCVGWEEWDERK